jgi:predicted RNA-binding protein with RPS1 domain
MAGALLQRDLDKRTRARGQRGNRKEKQPERLLHVNESGVCACVFPRVENRNLEKHASTHPPAARAMSVGRGRAAVRPSWMDNDNVNKNNLPGNLSVAASAPSQSPPSRSARAPPSFAEPPRMALSPDQVKLPSLNSVHLGTVHSVTDFGAFVSIKGTDKQGLLHANESAEGALEKGQTVFVKVSNLDEQRGRFGLTNRFIEQATGEDLDPDNSKRRATRTSTSASSSSRANPAPPMFSIHRGKVSGVREFGAFVDLPGGFCRGMIHIAQLVDYRVEKVEDVVREGDLVWVKVVGVETDPERGTPKVALSMKHVNQDNGSDLDPGNIELDTRRRSKSGAAPGLDAPAPRGDLVHRDAIKLIYSANDVSGFGGSKAFELIPEPAAGAAPAHQRTDGHDDKHDDPARRERKKRRKEEKKLAKRAKKERKKARKARRKEKKHAKKKKSKSKKRHRSSSTSSSSSSSSQAQPAKKRRRASSSSSSGSSEGV